MLGAGHPGPERRAEGPHGQAVGQDLAGPRLEGRDRVPRPRRPRPSTSTSSASTWSATAARPASATAARCRRRSPTAVSDERPGGRLGAVGQPQLRGPDQPRREDELPGLAAAVRRLRDRRDDGHRPLRRAARRGPPRRARVPEGHLAERGRGRGRRSRRPSSRTCSARATARCSTATSAGTRSRCRPATLFEWDAALDVRPPPAVLRGHAARAASRSRTSSGARVLAVLGDSVTTDHISPAGSIKRDGPAAAVPDRARRRGPATSTPTARGAATTR